MEGPSLLFTIVSFLGAIGVLVTVHEFGHYAVGRLCGVRAEVFSVGVGPAIFGRTDGRGTRWQIAALPLGGYVRFAGDMNPARAAEAGAGGVGTFQAARLWQRALIVLAGPAINVVFAIAIYASVIAAIGLPSSPPVVTSVQAGSAAATGGFLDGDRVLAIDGRAVDDFEDVTTTVRLRPGRPLEFTIGRDERTVQLFATPRTMELSDRFGNSSVIGQLGVTGAAELNPVATWRLPDVATVFAFKQLRVMVEATGQLIRGERSLDDLGGPVKIGKIAGESASLGVLPFVFLVAALSLNLAFINLLPIPMLDGGYLALYAVEVLRGRPVGQVVVDWAFRGGLALVLTVFVLVTVNDLASLIR